MDREHNGRDGASADEAQSIIRRCPSGALSYVQEGITHNAFSDEPEIQISENRRPLAAPDRDAIELAAHMLSEGRAEAERRQRQTRAWAGVGLGCAALASMGVRSVDMSRRRLLRRSLQCAALAALAPGVGLSILSEVFVPTEIRAFDALASRLTRIDPDAIAKFLT